MLRRANRRREAWFVFIPLAVTVLFVYLPFRLLDTFGMGGSPIGVNGLLCGVAALWLLGDFLARTGPVKAVLSALGVMMILSGVGVLMQGSRDMTLVVMAVLSLIPVLVLLLTRMGCRRRFSNARCIVLLLCFSVLVVFVLLLAAAIVLVITITPLSMTELWMSMLVGVPMGAGILGIIVFLLLLPFVLLSLYNEWYRQRFMGALRLERQPEKSERSAETE